MIANRGQKLLQYLLFLYILSLGFTDLLELPVVGKKIQFPEMMFIPLAMCSIWQFRHTLLSSFKPGPLELSMMISAAVSSQSGTRLEIAGIIYLVVVYIIFKSSLSIFPKPELFISNAIIFSGSVAALLGITGWIISQMGLQTILSMPADIH